MGLEDQVSSPRREAATRAGQLLNMADTACFCHSVPKAKSVYALLYCSRATGIKSKRLKKPPCNGWLYTGDIGVLDTDGYLHFLDRRKEMLKVKGMSVFPAEIEALLDQQPARGLLWVETALMAIRPSYRARRASPAPIYIPPCRARG